MTFDDLLPHIGWGRYQITNMILTMTMLMLIAMQVLSPIFIAYPMPYKCKQLAEAEKFCGEKWNDTSSGLVVPINAKGNAPNQCKRYNISDDKRNTTDFCLGISNGTATTEACHEHTFGSEGTVATSIVEDFDMVCERSWYKYLLQSVFMLGVFFAGLTFGKASDSVGRKNVVIVMTVGALVVSMAIAFVKSFVAYAILRGLVGFFCFHVPTIYVLASESTVSHRRAMVIQVGTFGFSLGTILLVPFAYLARNWVTLQFALTASYTFCIVVWWLFDESPRWLISRGNEKEGFKILKKIVKTNKCSGEVEALVNRFCEKLNGDSASSGESILEKNCKVATKRKVRNKGMSDTLRDPQLRIATIVLTYTWFATSCAFYGLTLNVANLGGNIYVTTLIMGLTAIPAYPLAIYMCNKVGRRFVISICFILGGVSCVPMYFVPVEYQVVQITMFLFGRVFSLIPFSTMFLITVETYPTVIRSTAVNYGSSVARLGAVVAPAIAMTESIHPTLPNILLGFIMILAGILILALPETRKAKMSETIQDASSYMRENPGPLLRMC